ncbi:MAG: hypothetical protein LBT22_04980 [Peptococcaceae bacterium]|jgi:hypothetical protein|nr:hypothetical protein [Peptococcaceae bacterium]
MNFEKIAHLIHEQVQGLGEKTLKMEESSFLRGMLPRYEISGNSLTLDVPGEWG